MPLIGKMAFSASMKATLIDLRLSRRRHRHCRSDQWHSKGDLLLGCRAPVSARRSRVATSRRVRPLVRASLAASRRNSGVGQLPQNTSWFLRWCSPLFQGKSNRRLNQKNKMESSARIKVAASGPEAAGECIP